MWRFLVSYSKETKNESKKIEIINSIGEMPKDAPEIIFEADKELDSYEEIDEFYDSKY